jgi:hypothetical protein
LESQKIKKIKSGKIVSGHWRYTVVSSTLYRRRAIGDTVGIIARPCPWPSPWAAGFRNSHDTSPAARCGSAPPRSISTLEVSSNHTVASTVVQCGHGPPDESAKPTIRPHVRAAAKSLASAQPRHTLPSLCNLEHALHQHLVQRCCQARAASPKANIIQCKGTRAPNHSQCLPWMCCRPCAAHCSFLQLRP